MKNYIKQLISILEKVADNPPPEYIIETPPQAKHDKKSAGPALGPFKSIEEWTGIEQIVFPSIERMTLEEVSQLKLPSEKLSTA